MYNEQLEQLIDAALADGELTEKEKQILFKKAQSFGIDIDEFEMVLDARLVKLKKNEAEKKAQAAPKSNKFGDVKKCPACGAIVQSFQGVCQECGYAFENVEANSSVRKLSAELEEKGVEKWKNDDGEWEKEEDYEKMAAVIKRFPIPTAKSDLIELITFLQTLLEGRDIEQDSAHDGALRNACEAKIQECLRKAKHRFPNDKDFTAIFNDLDDFFENHNKQIKEINRKNTIVGIILIIAGIALGRVIWLLDWKVFWKVLTECYTAALLIAAGLVKIVADKKK